MSSRAGLGAVWAAALVLAAAGASAEEVRPQLNPSVILNMLARPVESPEAAFNAGLRSDGMAARQARADDGEILPDGSVRYGRGSTSLTVTVRNPCPPGDFEHEAAYLRSLPGRSRR
jgi:hypothetical protein